MRRRYFRFGGFGVGFPPYGFFVHGPGRFPRRDDYIRMLQEYKEELEEELREVNKELDELSRMRSQSEGATDQGGVE